MKFIFTLHLPFPQCIESPFMQYVLFHLRTGLVYRKIGRLSCPTNSVQVGQETSHGIIGGY